jgi:Rrf2 family protein
MRFTSMFRYGLRALSILAANYGKGPISAKELSQRENLSPSFLEQLLAQLRRNGIVRGIRGPGGGFVLTKHPSKIRISEVMVALEGPVCVSRCLRPSTDPSAERCDRFDNCPAVPLLKKLDRDFGKVLKGYKLSDLA